MQSIFQLIDQNNSILAEINSEYYVQNFSNTIAKNLNGYSSL